MNGRCDWCGRPAVTKTYRTLNVDTEFEQTSSYCECKECSRLTTEEAAGKHTILCTFPDSDADYCKQFVVETEWLKKELTHNGKLGKDNGEREEMLRNFLDEYTWDETYFIYMSAMAEKTIVSEHVVA